MGRRPGYATVKLFPSLTFTVSTSNSTSSDSSFSALSIFAMVVGAFVVGYGLLVVPVSVFGGAWIVAIGLSVFLSGLFATGWAGDRFDLDPETRRNLSLTFALFAIVLFVAFVVVNYASFDAFEVESSP